MRVKVAGTGLAYDSVDEAIADVDRMEELRDVEVSDLREAGDEAGAERAADRWNRQIQKTRDAIRGAQEREASATSQPRNRPRSRKPREKKPDASLRPRSAAAASRAGRRADLLSEAWSKRSRRPRSLQLRSGTSGRLLRESGAIAATSSVTKLVFQLFGLLVGLALVLVVLESETTKRSAVGGIVDLVIRAVGAIVDPVDPFSRAAWKPTPAAPPVSGPSSVPLSRRPARTTVLVEGVR